MKALKMMMLVATLILLFHLENPLNAQNMKEEKVPRHLSAFPVGEANVQYAKYFIGQSWLARLTWNKDLNCPVSNVTFEPGCRNNWHSHTGGQLLIAVGGRGYYQEKGKPARVLESGDVVEIAPDIVHWHGAAPDSWFSHLAIECNSATNKNTWLEAVDDAAYAEATAQSSGLSPGATRNYHQWFPKDDDALAFTDPELAEVFGNFAFDETQQYGELDTRIRILITMASAIAMNTEREYRKTLQAALSNGITPLEVKEVLYHAIPYVGMAKVEGFLVVANEFLTERGVSIPLEPQSVTTPATRAEKGLALQKSIFGSGHIDKMYETSSADQLYFQQYLSANCFGDYQTRPLLDVKIRELLTFSILISLGGCESQVKGHIRGNVNVGNDKATLLAAVTQLLPYIGYPRTLNAVACLNEVIPENR